MIEFMTTAAKNRELPLSVQFASFFSLWFIWLGVAGFVVWRDWKLQEQWRYYDIPFVVYPLVFSGMPLVLVGAGILILGRVKPVSSLGRVHRTLYYAVACTTAAGLIILLTCGTAAMGLPKEMVRE